MRRPTSGGDGRGGAGGPGDRGLSDAELRAILDGMSRVMEKAFDQLDDQTRALSKLAAAVAALEAKLDAGAGAGAGADPERVAAVAYQAVRSAVLPALAELAQSVDTFSGKEELLRARLRGLRDRKVAESWWRPHLPAALWVLAALVAVPVVPNALGLTETGCRLMLGTWYDSEGRQDACSFWGH